MPQTGRQHAMIYEQSLMLLQESISQSIQSDGDVPPMAWWEDESTRQLTLQIQKMRSQLPADYKPAVVSPRAAQLV